jgi:glutaredoxin 3
MSKSVKVYSTDYCPYCDRAKALLRKKGVEFEDIDVTHSPEQRNFLIEATGRRTVPQIFIHGTPIGGCDELYALDRAGKLETMLMGSSTT